MRFERITNTRHNMYEKAIELYNISFPEHERREEPSRERIISDAEYNFNLIYDGDEFVGILLCWETERFIYVEHFCILPEMRGRGCGQRALELLGRRGKTVILEIDPPSDEISVRRKGFYERCGFKENGYAHIHPPYHEKNRGHKLIVMTAPHEIDHVQYEQFARYLGSRVMAEAFR